ncbi:MAG: glucose 1-dehydrogenase [Alphaproteobacteria bacterium]|nr:glucose 1-dehydrogenase [Alphaproteobacteria bacterium]
MLLKDKVAIVTGASTGLGKAAAIAMAREGAAVMLAGLNTEAGEAVREEIRHAGGRAVFEHVDVAEPEAVERMVARTVEAFGRLDLAYNNAGIESPSCATQELDIDKVKRAYDINVHGVLLSMKYEIPHMLKAGGGAIVNATSIWGIDASPGRAIYVSAKHAVSGLTKTAALELADKNIRVNAVAPGPILTPMLLRDWKGQVDKAAAIIPMGRVGRAEEVADAVVWLCSERASFITGIILPIDGGVAARMG